MAIRYSFYSVAATASVVLMGALGMAPRAAHAQLFNFENQAATFVSNGVAVRTGALSSLTLTNAGLSLTLTRPNNTGFDIVDNTAGFQTGKAPSFGTRSLDPFFDTSVGFVGNFSSAVTNLSLDFGDYSGDDDDSLTLSAFSGANGTGTLLGTTTVLLPDSRTGGFDAATAVVGGTGIQSFTISGASSQIGSGIFSPDNSVFIDNIGVNGSAAPEPGSLVLLLGAGGPALAGGVAVRLRRKK